MNRASGEDATGTELVKGGDRCLWKNIYLFISYVWEKELLPEDWKTAIIRHILKGNKLKCKNY
jgi:hypothetical protein